VSTPPTTSTSTAAGTGQQIVGKGSNRCVDITGQSSNDGTQLQIYDCGTQWNQKWTLTNGAFKNPQSGKCINETGTGNGSSVTLQTCNGSTAQQWQVRSNGNIVNTASGRCLDVIGQATGNGSKLQIYDCVAAGQSNQQWTLR